MADSSRKPWEVDVAAAKKALKHVVFHTLDVDWLGVDPAGNVAVFLGEEDESPVPSLASPRATSVALEAVAQAITTRQSAPKEDAYRVAAARPGEPVFDVPRTATGALHEHLFEGYPHLFVASLEGIERIRELTSTFGGREVPTRGALAVAVTDMGQRLYDTIHDEAACAGCRAIDDPEDPRPRSPEALATAGLYVFVFGREASGNAVWVRVASPGDPAKQHELQELARHEAAFVPFDVRFEDAIILGTPMSRFARRG